MCWKGEYSLLMFPYTDPFHSFQGSRIPHGDGAIPIKMILFLYFVLFIFGSLLYPQNQRNPTFTLQNLYFRLLIFFISDILKSIVFFSVLYHFRRLDLVMRHPNLP